MVGNADLVVQTRHAAWFLESLRVLGVVAVAFALYSLFRPVAFRWRTLPQQRVQARNLLERYGGGALDFFKLWPDKSYFFSADQRCVIAYRTVWRVALALGDPVGPKEGLENTVQQFARYCFDNGWDVAFHQVRPDFLDLYERTGLESLKIGEEAVVDLERFANETIHDKHMRHARNKLPKQGYKLGRYEPPHGEGILDRVEEVSNEWLQIPGHHERTFSLGAFDRSYLNETPLVTVEDPDGVIIAFVNLIPSYRDGEATFDLMRHRLDAPNGTMDFVFVQLMLALYDSGYRFFNMGLAPFAGVGQQPDDSLRERAAGHLADQLGRWVSYQGVRHYKNKFDPIWEERYLIYQGGPMGLARTALALTRATEG